MPGENTSTLNVTVTAPTVREGTDSHAIFTLAFDRALSQDSVFYVRTGEETATTFGVDYGVPGGFGLEYSFDGGHTWTAVVGKLMTVPAGATGALVRTPITNDTEAEIDETFGFMVIGVSGDITPSFYAEVHATIVDNDRPTMTVGNVTVTEGTDAYATFGVNFSGALGQRTLLNLSLSSGTATHGSDFGRASKTNDIQYSLDNGKTWLTASAGKASVPEGSTGLLVRTAVIDDSTQEKTEQFTLNVKQMDGPGVGTQASGTATICDNDAPQLSVSSTTVREGTDAYACFTVDLSKASNEATTVNLRLLAGTATGGGVDYGSTVQVSTDNVNWVTASSATLAAGKTRLYVRTAITNDQTQESSETFKLEATVTSGATANPKAEGTATILDDDTPCLSVADIKAYEGGKATFTVQLSRALDHDVTFQAVTQDGTGRAGKHYVAINGTYTIKAGCTSVQICTKLPAPDGDWTAQNFLLKLKNVCGCGVSDDTAQCTIIDTVSPLVLDLNGDGVQTLAMAAGVAFDHDADGRRDATGWADSRDGLLAIDLDGNGLIDSGRELFGNNTAMAGGTQAGNGFEALAAYDSNHDGRMDADDAAFAQLLVWRDANSNGVSDAGELASLAQHGIVSLDLAYTEGQSAQNDNLFAQNGSFTLADGSSRAMTDVWFQAGAPIDPRDLLQADAQGLGGGEAPVAAASPLSRAEMLLAQGLDFHGQARMDTDLLEALRACAAVAA